MRIILYTGKGGVGKTTVAAATALRAAEMGYRTILRLPRRYFPIQSLENLIG